MQLNEALVRVYDALNRASVRYVLVGGCAVVLHDYYRTTHDIDLLVDASEENVGRLKRPFSKYLRRKKRSRLTIKMFFSTQSFALPLSQRALRSLSQEQ